MLRFADSEELVGTGDTALADHLLGLCADQEVVVTCVRAEAQGPRLL